MKNIRKVLTIFLLYCFGAAIAQAQATIPATGGTATGSGGSVSLTVGQLVWHMFPGSNGTVLQGVQQPYEIP